MYEEPERNPVDDDTLLQASAANAEGDAKLATNTLRRIEQLAEATRSPRIDKVEIAQVFVEMKLVKLKYHVDRLTSHHRIIVDLIEREQGI